MTPEQYRKMADDYRQEAASHRAGGRQAKAQKCEYLAVVADRHASNPKLRQKHAEIVAKYPYQGKQQSR